MKRSILCLALVIWLCVGLVPGLGEGPHAPDGLRTAAAGEQLSAKERALVELGRRLFFDPIVSRSGSRACASCHDPEHGFSDPLMVSEDDIGMTRRHSQTLLDGRHNPTAHWDGEFDSIEELVTARLGLVPGTRGRGFRSHGSPLRALGDAPLKGAHRGGPTHKPGAADTESPTSLPQERRVTGGGGYGAPPPSTPPSTPTPPTSDGPSTPSTPSGRQPGQRMDPTTPPSTPSPENVTTPESRAAASERRRQLIDLARDIADLPRVQDVLEEGGRYAEAFQAAFGSRSVTTARLAQAIASYCRSIEHTEAPFDRWQRGDEDAVSASARRGFELFKTKARCSQCHTHKGRDALFTDFEFHNTGISWLGAPKGELETLRAHAQDMRSDVGRIHFSRRKRDRRAFKTPTLRDVTRRGPFMHDGQFQTLEQVVRYYMKGGSSDPLQDKRIKPFKLTDQEVQDLVAFLGTLQGATRPGLADRLWRVRPTEQALRFVDAKGRPMAGLAVGLVSAGDVLPGGKSGDRRETLITDAKGFIRFMPPHRTHTLLDLPDGLVPAGGFMVPDTCRKADVVVPIAGRVNIVMALPTEALAPKQILAEHIEAKVLPGHPLPRTLFVRTQDFCGATAQIVRYEGWRRMDVPATVRLRIPGLEVGSHQGEVDLAKEETHQLDLR